MKNRIIGLMAGISIGFAAWGSVRPQPDAWRVAGSVQTGKEWQTAEKEQAVVNETE